jgi:hypothetical protein
MPKGEQAAGPVLSEPEALGKVREGVSARVSKTVDNTGKAIAAAAGLGVFFIATGYFVEWQRTKRGGLPSEQVLPLIPKEQIAAAGVRELAISILFGGSILVLFGVGLVWLARVVVKKGWSLPEPLGRIPEIEVVGATFLIGVFTALVVPFDAVGLLVAATVTGLLGYGLHLVHSFLTSGNDARFPLWRLTLAAAIAAVVLSGARQHEFPQPRPVAIAVLTDGTKLKVAYVASDSDKVLLRRQRKDRPTELIVVRDEDLKSLRVIKSSYVFPLDRSLLDEIVGLVRPGFRLSCIPPECRWRESTQIGPSLFF